MRPLLLSHFTATSCMGTGRDALREALRLSRSGLAPCHFADVTLNTCVGEVTAVDTSALPLAQSDYDCRNNRLARIGLMQDGFADACAEAVARCGAHRVGVILGTSTAGIFETELAYRHRDSQSGALPATFSYRGGHNVFSVADYVRLTLGLTGPAAVVSSACSSSAKVFATAARMIDTGVIDAAVVGGVDSLCLTTLHGFNSLEVLSAAACRPFDPARDGISIGEAAAFALLERPTDTFPENAVLLTGYGESSDAHHMSSPHPDGRGARLAMEAALQRAGLSPSDIGYINLHGTATPSNDAAEGHAVRTLFGAHTPANSTKGASGHTLGAAGGLEAVICAIALQEGLLPGSPGTATADPAIDIDYVCAPRHGALRHVLSNSFGFGGTNATLVLSRGDAWQT